METEYLATYSSMEKAREGLFAYMKFFGHEGYRQHKDSLTWTNLESDREYYIITNELDKGLANAN